ncbi:hybrid sensor histidine kinase/response regulator [Anabaena sp. UHCC 0187]|uniref:hybrid sensor histidine kinase/response regulator n=1 Tax=Anabaena sp. UHCC 0187 TaxID=2590018 RepID=UPI00144641E8|nr:hybrid sensor histidine kinase/response regulator [Anabaena sp. UHCC 0187]MTJ11472.1 hybrid sensor histidine kinase/response regulator [Anabaena sp. UHCC 0187]
MEQTTIHILLVEDSPTDVVILNRIFSRANPKKWHITHVEQLEEAIQISANSSQLNQGNFPLENDNNRKFDVVLLDLSLPDSIGIETLKEYRAAVPDIPVVVLTGLDSDDLALQAMGEGAQDYIVKDDITMPKLERAIRYAIERGEILNKLRESEEKTRQALAREQELNELKSNFVAMVSHEFRTPMTIIRSSVELLEHHGANLNEERRLKYFLRIQRAIDKMLQLLDDILFMNKTESVKMKYQPVLLDLEKFCLEIIEINQLSLKNQYKIIFNYQGKCEQVEMDEDLLGCILSNLLSNAIKYSHKHGQIYFDVICTDHNATFCIQDQGIGIPPKDQGDLFQNFYRASNVQNIQGTGLGLAIVRKCVDIHEGKIEMKSEIGVGTTVIVTLQLQCAVQ